MELENDEIKQFIDTTVALSQSMHEDNIKAARLLDLIRRNTTFEAIIAQSEQHKLLDECKAFAAVIEHWVREYPLIIVDYKILLNNAIQKIQEAENIQIIKNPEDIEIIYDNKLFKYEKNDRGIGQYTNLKINAETKELLEKQENKIIKEITEIISLEIHMKKLIEEIGAPYYKNIKTISVEVIKANDVNQPLFIQNMNQLVTFWKHIGSMLERIKRDAIKAVEIDETVSKELNKYFLKERKEEEKKKKITISLKILMLLGELSLNIIPGGSIISALVSLKYTKDIYKIARETKSIL